MVGYPIFRRTIIKASVDCTYWIIILNVVTYFILWLYSMHCEACFGLNKIATQSQHNATRLSAYVYTIYIRVIWTSRYASIQCDAMLYNQNVDTNNRIHAIMRDGPAFVQRARITTDLQMHIFTAHTNVHDAFSVVIVCGNGCLINKMLLDMQMKRKILRAISLLYIIFFLFPLRCARSHRDVIKYTLRSLLLSAFL